MGESIDFVRQLEEQMQVYGVKTSRFAVDEESLRRNGGGLEEYFFQDYDYDQSLANIQKYCEEGVVYVLRDRFGMWNYSFLLPGSKDENAEMMHIGPILTESPKQLLLTVAKKNSLTAEQERELDRQRMAFFNAASHELKTPVTILKGQLSGMLDGVGVYQDRDKYLLRSLQVTGRMENLVREMLAISRMETGSVAVKQESVDLSALVERQLALDAGLLEQRDQRLASKLTPGVTVTGDPSLLGKAVGNLLSNASLYSPEGAEIRVWCGMQEGSPVLTVENTVAHISEEALPHLFEAFYREEGSRNRATGGSGLGLYLVKMILDRHGAECAIENTADGVRATVRFSD